MAVMKRKRLTQREKDERARIKKMLQEEGILPADKKRLNRKKFAKGVLGEWNEEMNLCEVGDLYCFMNALACLVSENMSKVTEEQVGVLKLLKLSVEIKKFQKKLKEQGRGDYNLRELLDAVVFPVLKL